MLCPNCGWENPPGANYCAKCGAALSAPALAPGVRSSFGHGWRALRRNFADLFLAAAVFLALNLPVAVILGLIAVYATDGDLFIQFESLPGAFEALAWEYRLAGGVFSIFYSLPLLIGLSFIFLRAVRGEKIEFARIFAAFKNYRNILPLTAVYVIVPGGISYLLGLLTVHVPALGVFLSLAWSIFCIVLFCKLAFLSFLLLDRPLKPLDALRTSWRLTRGHEWQVFFIGLLAVLMFAAVALVALVISLVYVLLPAALYVGLVIGVLGYIFLSMWVLSAFASLYHAISSFSNPPPFPPAK